MSVLAISAALGASFCWASGAMLAHRPATLLGAFELTRVQLISSSALLLAVVLGFGGWSTITWEHWPGIVGNALLSVFVGNLAMMECLRRGGPRRMELLFALNAPMAAVMGYTFLGEFLSPTDLTGCAIALSGVGLAILFGSGKDLSFDPIQGSLSGMVFFGLLAAACQAAGLILIKPAMLAGTDPWAASFLRTGGAAFLIAFIALWPTRLTRQVDRVTVGIITWAIIPGFLGYVCAVSLILYALAHYNTGVVAVLGSTAPVLLLPMTWLKTRQCPPIAAWAGACLAVAGTSLILVT